MLGRDVLVLVVEHLVELDEELLVDRVEKVGHLEHFGVQDDAVAAWYWDRKELKQLDDLLVGALHLLLEKNHDELVDLVDGLVDRGLCKVLEGL